MYKALILSLVFSSKLFAMEADPTQKRSISPHQQPLTEEKETLSSQSRKVQIQQNPPLWLHVKVDRNSSYSAYANAWVTLGSDENARRYPVKSIYLSLSFESTREDTKTDSFEIELSQRTSKVCYNQAFAYAKTIGPDGSVSASTY